jgi:hypothetical protein
MKKSLKVALIVIGAVFIFLITYWFLYVRPPMFILQMSLPDNAKDLPWSFEEGSRIYNQRIQSQYLDGMSAIDLTKQLQEEGYNVLVVARQEKEPEKPYCAITWWTVNMSEDNLYRITSDMGSHSQVCAKAKQMQVNYSEKTSLSQLTEQLREDGFDVDISANIKRNRFPCGLTWTIDWNENDAFEVHDLQGRFRYNCI